MSLLLLCRSMVKVTVDCEEEMKKSIKSDFVISLWMWLEGMKLQMPFLLVAEREEQNTNITESQREKTLSPWCCKTQSGLFLFYYRPSPFGHLLFLKGVPFLCPSFIVSNLPKNYNSRVCLISLSTFSPPIITIHFFIGKIPVHSMQAWPFFRMVAFLRERRRE